jgi:hypothetical protein
MSSQELVRNVGPGMFMARRPSSGLEAFVEWSGDDRWLLPRPLPRPGHRHERRCHPRSFVAGNAVVDEVWHATDASVLAVEILEAFAESNDRD